MLNLHDEYCVAFIDILGFKFMTSSEKIGEYTPIITDAIIRMREVKTYNNHIEFSSEIFDSIKVVQFADSIVVLFPKTPHAAFAAIRSIMALQLELAGKGIFLRGSINSGQMYVDTLNDIYFGEAWNKAVYNENEAIYPRVLLENSIAYMIIKWLAEMNESVGEFYIDEDGYFVIDSYGIMAILDLNWPIRDSLNMILQNIHRIIKASRVDDKILRKYLWIVKHIENKQKKKLFDATILKNTHEEILTQLQSR
jgi:hypothetical protein